MLAFKNEVLHGQLRYRSPSINMLDMLRTGLLHCQPFEFTNNDDAMATTGKPRKSKTRHAKVAKAPLVGEKILSVASDLFAQRGIQAVGVEEIVQSADVAKISLYRSFASKDDLVVAWLNKRREGFWRQWDDITNRYRGEPRNQIRAIIEHIEGRTTQAGYLGCPFLKICCEFPPGAHPGRLLAEQVKRELRKRLHVIVAQLDVSDAKLLANALLLLIEGAYGLSRSLSGKDAPGHSLGWAAEALIDSQSVRDAAAAR